LNEEIHIKRVVENAWLFAKDVLVVDSFSTDRTVEIAESLNARVLQNKFAHQAQQMKWAMENGNIQTEWLLRLDADEYLTEEAIHEVNNRLPSLNETYNGVIFKRRVYFMGQWMRHGGYYPVKLLRLWRMGSAQIEQRWMDEHIFLTKGSSITFEHDLVDDNLNSLTWWTAKHNDYATREAIDIMNKKYRFMDLPDNINMSNGQTSRKRWYKNNFYLRLPLFFRCFLYFNYRYWIKLGFLDGTKGLVWHFLQGFWYRFLVDAKIMQMTWWSKKENKPIQQVITEKYQVRL
jgi:glycosyltransferase involved in cell wall biosynthesis